MNPIVHPLAAALFLSALACAAAPEPQPQPRPEAAPPPVAASVPEGAAPSPSGTAPAPMTAEQMGLAAPTDAPLDRPGVDPTGEENLRYRAQLYWDAKLREDYTTTYRLESKVLHEKVPTLAKYLMRVGMSPKRYFSSTLHRIENEKPGVAVAVFHQEFQVVGEITTPRMRGNQYEVWLIEDGDWYRQYVDFQDSLRKRMGFGRNNVPPTAGPNAKPATPFDRPSPGPSSPPKDQPARP